MIARVTIDGYKGARRTHELGACTLVHGPNGSGKSSVLESVAMLTGSADQPVASPRMRDTTAGGITITATLSDGRTVEMSSSATAASMGKPRWRVRGQAQECAAIWGAGLPITGAGLRDASATDAVGVLARACATLEGAQRIVDEASAQLADLGIDAVSADHPAAALDLMTRRVKDAASESRAKLKRLDGALSEAQRKAGVPGPSVTVAEAQLADAMRALAAVESLSAASSPRARLEALRRQAAALESVPCAAGRRWTAGEEASRLDPFTDDVSRVAGVDLCGTCPMTEAARRAASEADRLAQVEEPAVRDTRAETDAVTRARGALGVALAREDGQRRAGEILAEAQGIRERADAAEAAAESLAEARAELLRLGAEAIARAAADVLPDGWRVEMREGRAGLAVGDVWCSGLALSGAQRVALGVALHVALVRLLQPGTGARILCVELDELDDARCTEMMARLRALVDAGELAQVVAARWRPAGDAAQWSGVALGPMGEA
jgi:energy-coupling factor transporter ATP-binding protein EcfA2